MSSILSLIFFTWESFFSHNNLIFFTSLFFSNFLSLFVACEFIFIMFSLLFFIRILSYFLATVATVYSATVASLTVCGVGSGATCPRTSFASWRAGWLSSRALPVNRGFGEAQYDETGAETSHGSKTVSVPCIWFRKLAFDSNFNIFSWFIFLFLSETNLLSIFLCVSVSYFDVSWISMGFDSIEYFISGNSSNH